MSARCETLPSATTSPATSQTCTHKFKPFSKSPCTVMSRVQCPSSNCPVGMRLRQEQPPSSCQWRWVQQTSCTLTPLRRGLPIACQTRHVYYKAFGARQKLLYEEVCTELRTTQVCDTLFEKYPSISITVVAISPTLTQQQSLLGYGILYHLCCIPNNLNQWDLETTVPLVVTSLQGSKCCCLQCL